MKEEGRLRVGDVELHVPTREVKRAGKRVPLQPRVYDLFVYLVEHRDRVVTSSELLENLWPNETVVPDVLKTALHGLRRALRDDPEAPSFIRTIRGVGYQLIAPVSVAQEDSPVREARHAAFVGRDEEKRLFASMIEGESPIRLLFVHGPPGIGKTTLLHELAYECRSRGIDPVSVSGVTAGPFVDGFLRSLARNLGCAPTIDAIRVRLALGARVVFVDDLHLLEASEDWLREELWPALPSATRLVLAGRRAPSRRWTADPAWSSTAQSRDLGALTEIETRELLSARGLDARAAATVFETTRGHPLAVVLAAETLARGDTRALVDRTHILAELAERFTDQIVDARRRRTFEVACMLEEVSESMLAQLLGPGVAEDGMEWLSTLSFVERHRDAVRVHTLVRDAVFARMLERSPGRLADVLEATSRLVMDALKRSPDPEAMLRAARMFIDLGRFDPEVRRNYLASDAGPECTVRPAGKKDFASIVEMVRVHEGDASAAIAETWLERPETSAWLVDDGSNAPAGCIVTLRVGIRDRDASARDPVVAGMFGHLEATGRALEGDALLVHRFLLSAKDHQAPTAVTKACHGVMLVELVRNGTRTDPAHHVFTVYSEADLWEPAARSASLTRLREREVTIGGRRYTPFYLSLREMPVDVWLANVARQLLETVRGRSPSN